MKRGAATGLQSVIVLIGLGVLAALVAEPHFEGRNVNATLFEIYFRDPFLAYVYLASIPFFVGLYQAFKVVGYAGHNKIVSQASARSVRTVKYCALITVCAIVATNIFLMIAARTNDEDAAGAVALGSITTIIFIVIAITATKLERTIQKRVLIH